METFEDVQNDIETRAHAIAIVLDAIIKALPNREAVMRDLAWQRDTLASMPQARRYVPALEELLAYFDPNA